MERRRIRSVAVLLALVFSAQVLTLVARQGHGARPARVALAPGAEAVVSDELLSEGRVLRATVTREAFSPPAHALYSERGRADPLTGRMLAVGSAFGEGPAIVPTSETPGFRLVDLGNRSVAVGHDRAWTWVTWSLANCTAVCQGYAAGRNLSETEVVDAARTATVDRNAPTVTDVPAGLTLLVTSRLDLQGFDAPGAQSVWWLWDGTGVVFIVVPDERLVTLMRFFVDGGPVEVRGRPGSAGEVARVGSGGDIVARAWSEGGRSVVVASDRLSYDDFDRFVAGLRVARAGEWDALRSRVLDVSSEALIDQCRAAGGSYTAVGRQAGRYRWAVGFAVGQQSTECHVILTADRSSLGLGAFSRPVRGAASVSTVAVSGATDPVGLFVVGAAPPGTARVRLDVADGRQVDAELAAVGPAPGERYYAAFVEGAVRARPTVVALDGAGAEIARVAGGAPTALS
ncbi:MAG TPA: hypothetical protein VM388_03510 [Acidimicrobiales bacterium]|nr:hypothetical protein [Acidimicrobiales bacterium]